MLKIYSWIFPTNELITWDEANLAWWNANFSWDNSFLEQKAFDTIENIISLEIKEDINNISYMNITINKDNLWLREFQRVQYIDTNMMSDEVIFDWYIDELIPDLNTINLVVKDFRQLMNKKACIQDYNFIWKTLQEIVETIVNDWNLEYSENWSVNANFSTKTIDKDLKEWDTFFDIFWELSPTFNCNWITNWTEIYFNEIIWEDKTSGANFTEIIYNTEEPVENNLSNIKISKYSTISNIIIWTDWTTKVKKTNPASINTYWPLIEYKNFRPWNLDDDTQKYLDLKSNPQFLYDIEPDINSINVNIWDKIRLRIENVSEYLNIEWDVIVNTKKTKLENNTRVVEIGVSDIYVSQEDFTRKINNIKKVLNILKI